MAGTPEPRAAFGPRALGVLAVVLAATIALRLPLLDVPLERDEGEYAYIAWRLLEGDVPYRDAFDQKPPGVFAAYAASFVAFGESVRGIRIGLLVWTLGTLAVVTLITRRLAGTEAACFAAAFFGVASSAPGLLAHSANTEMAMVLPMAAAVLCALRGLETGSRLDWFAAGALAMAACWFKQVAATSGMFVLGLVVVGILRRAGDRRLLPALAWMAVGALAVSLPVGAWFAARGAWEPFVDAVFLHNLRYVQSMSANAGVAALSNALVEQAPDLWPSWVLGLAALVLPTSRRVAVPMAAWAACLFLGVAAGFYFRAHYFVQLLPALCVLAGMGGAAVAAELGRRTLPRAAALTAVALLAVAPPVLARVDLLSESPDRIARRLYGANPFPESPVFAELIREASGPDDTVFILGSEPQILFHARRRSATRYIFVYPLTGAYPDSADRQREALEEFEDADPLFVVVVGLATSHGTRKGGSPLLFEEMTRIVASRYRLEAMAWPEDNENPFRLEQGRRARNLIESNPEWAASAESIRLYRRIAESP